MNFMDVLSDLLNDCTPEPIDAYQDILRVEDILISQLRTIAGDDLTDKFIAVNAEQMSFDRLACFLRGLRPGAELLAI